MYIQQLRKRLKKRAERSRAAHDELCGTYLKQSPYWVGAARILDLGATYSIRCPHSDPKLVGAAGALDAAALRSDWARAGGFLWEALDSVTEELDDETLVRVLSEWAAARESEQDRLASSKRPSEVNMAVPPARAG